MENILQKSDLTVGKLQMQVVDKGFYFVFQKHQRPGLHGTHSPARQRGYGTKLMISMKASC